MIDALMAFCIAQATAMYQLPANALPALLAQEAGRVGTVSPNKNGTSDLGPFQINTIWVDRFAAYWRVPRDTAYKQLRDNSCWNAAAAAAILRLHWNETKDIRLAIGRYHSRTPHIARRYTNSVLQRALRRQCGQAGFKDPRTRCAEIRDRINSDFPPG